MAIEDTRRLAAILAADVAGYSRLMGTDEPATVAGLRGHRAELTDPEIARHRGRIVNTAGDSILVEFPSAVDAVRCAEFIQRGMAARNAAVPENRRIVFRIGINVGDVISEGTEIYGDGVNIAARLEGICEPGGIAIGRNVYEQVHGKLPFAWQDAGPQHLKNIAEPVRVYRWRTEAAARPRAIRLPRRWRALLAAVAALAVVAIGGSAAYRFLPVLNPAKRPPLSIVVLPFDNLGGDPAQDYFVDALVEDLITDLSRISGAFVIARNTSFTYKGKPFDVKQVAQDLNVRYVLEGSVQRQGREVRMTVQLIDGQTGAHLWAERFDRTLDNIFMLQSEVVGRMARALNLELLEAEARHAEQLSQSGLEARDYVVRARVLSFKPRTAEMLQEQLAWVRKALALEPDNARAWALLAGVHINAAIFGFSASREESLRLGLEAAQRAVAFDPKDADLQNTLAFANRATGRNEQSLEAADTCIALNRNAAPCYYNKSLALVYLGRAEEALRWNAKAIELSPRDPLSSFFYTSAQSAHLQLGHFEASVAEGQRALARDNKNAIAYPQLAAAYANRGELEQAREVWGKFQSFPLASEFATLAQFRESGRRLSKNPVFLEQRERYFIAGLRKVGVPEQ